MDCTKRTSALQTEENEEVCDELESWEINSSEYTDGDEIVYITEGNQIGYMTEEVWNR